MIASIAQWCRIHDEKKHTPSIMRIINIDDKVLIASCWTYRLSENYVFCQPVFGIQCSVNWSCSTLSYCFGFNLSNIFSA